MYCNACDLTVVHPAFATICPKCQGALQGGKPRVKPRSTDTAKRKMAICRSNICGQYNSETDTCRILTDQGKAGAIGFLLISPHSRCVADRPLF